MTNNYIHKYRDSVIQKYRTSMDFRYKKYNKINKRYSKLHTVLSGIKLSSGPISVVLLTTGMATIIPPILAVGTVITALNVLLDRFISYVKKKKYRYRLLKDYLYEQTSLFNRTLSNIMNDNVITNEEFNESIDKLALINVNIIKIKADAKKNLRGKK